MPNRPPGRSARALTTTNGTQALVSLVGRIPTDRIASKESVLLGSVQWPKRMKGGFPATPSQAETWLSSNQAKKSASTTVALGAARRAFSASPGSISTPVAAAPSESAARIEPSPQLGSSRRSPDSRTQLARKSANRGGV